MLLLWLGSHAISSNLSWLSSQPTNLHLTDTMRQLKKTFVTYNTPERFLPPPAQNPTHTSDFSAGLLLCFIIIFRRILSKPNVGKLKCIKFPQPPESLAARCLLVLILRYKHIWISQAHLSTGDSKAGLWLNRQTEAVLKFASVSFLFPSL